MFGQRESGRAGSPESGAEYESGRHLTGNPPAVQEAEAPASNILNLGF